MRLNSRAPKVAAVFVNFNDGKDIIRSSKDLLSYPDVSFVIVVDNGSTDNSLEIVKEYKKASKNLYFIENNANLGFARAANRGIKKALELGAEYIIVLNPDLVFKKGFITQLIKVGVDMAQMALKFKRDGEWVYDFGGKINWMLGRTYHLENDRSIPPSNAVADYVSGGATLVRREVYEKAGLFDERYFMYFEDVEHSRRARKAGFTLVVEPKVVIEHKLENAKQTKNCLKLKINLESNFRFINQCVPWYFKPTAYAYWLMLALKTWLTVNLSLRPQGPVAQSH